MTSEVVMSGHHSTPMVGRSRELKVLDDVFDALAGGLGGSVSVVAPAGGGATRLLTHVRRLATDRSFNVGFASGWAGGGAPPWWPWQDLLRQVGVEPSSLGTTWPMSLPDRFEMFSGMLERISARAAEQPVVLVVDDLHLLDPGAVLLLRYVVRSLGKIPLLVICSVRPHDELDDAIAAHVADIRKAGVTLQLAPLEADDVRSLLDRSSSALDDDLHAVMALSGGNPLLVREILATTDGTAFRPTSVLSIVGRRLAALSSVTREVLTLLALVDEPVNAALVPALVGRPSAEVDLSLTAAEAAGLVRLDPAGRVVLAHHLIVDALLQGVDRAEQARRHDRIADVIERVNPSQVVLVARHLIRSGSIEPTAPRARAALRRAGAAGERLTAARSFEAAADLAERTIGLCDETGVEVSVSLLLDAARNHLSSGALRKARPWFRRAADCPRSTPIEVAFAAIGLGGVWVHEHRGVVEHAEFLSLLERARSGIGIERADLAARLDLRLAVERVYTRDGSDADVAAALSTLRDVGSAKAIAEGLSLVHHTRLGPASDGRERRALADEVVRVAADADDPVTGAMGLLWRAVDSILTGDVRADRAITEARLRADALQVQSVLYVLDAIEVMRDLRAGRVDEAEAAAAAVFQRGCDIGDADAVGYYGGQLLVIGWLRLRDLDQLLALARSVASSPTLVDGDLAPRAAAATLGAFCGQRVAAEADLDVVMAAPLRPRVSSNHLVTLFCAAEAASVLGSAVAARAVYAALEPFASLPIVGSLGVVCLGSVDRSLGVAATTFGDADLALRHLERAVRENHRLGNRVMAAISEGELACALLRRGDRADTARARSIGSRAVETLASMHLDERSRHLADQLNAMLLRRSSVPVLEQHESEWTLSWRGRQVHLPDSVGVQRLARILEHPGVEIDARDLAGDLFAEARHDVHDASALASYRHRITELRVEIDQLEADADLGRAEAARRELDDLLSGLEATMGRGGRSRSFIDSGERARVTVRKSISRVLDAIRAQDDQLADELAACVHTGHVCRFELHNDELPPAQLDSA